MHMIKLCVGVATLEELEGYRSERAHWWGADYGEDVHVHRTRMRPKRAAEIEGQGSIYWVISGVVRCRRGQDEHRALIGLEGDLGIPGTGGFRVAGPCGGLRWQPTRW